VYRAATSMKLPPAPCPLCKAALVSRPFLPNSKGGATAATDFESCLRRCEVCGVGLSNGLSANVAQLQKIDRDLLRGLPEWLREDCQEVLARSLNIRNRAAKRWKFQSWGSEDQATWVVFRFLQREGQFGATLAGAGISVTAEDSSEPAMLIWGVPVPPQDPFGALVRSRLVSVLKQVDRTPMSHTEPDVVLDFGPAGLIFFEVKCGSENDGKTADYPGWSSYLDGTPAFRAPETVRASGLYQLARNWRCAWDLARDRPLTLVNLGPEALFTDHSSERMHQFSSGLAIDGMHQFSQVTWGQLLSAAGPLPEWLRNYTELRKLPGRPGCSDWSPPRRRDLPAG
jgi:hypothetical protein